MPEDTESTPLDEAIAAYLREEEAGRAPDRDEWIRRHPAVAEGLRAFWENRDRFESLADRGAPTVAEGTVRINLMAKPRPPAGGVGKKALPATQRLEEPMGGRFGDYVLGEEVARGAMGIVYQARQVSLDRPVALKMMLDSTFPDPEDVVRFRKEARATSRLEHANIVPIYDVGECRGRQYYTMRWISGGDLSDAMEGLRGDPCRAARLMATVARAVDHAHQHGVLHRDLKPANILLDAEGIPHVADFGLAKCVDEPTALTLTGRVMGTASYMSPEQASGDSKRVTAASDVYSLGAIFYEMLTGEPPFSGGNPMEVLVKVREEEPAHPASRNPGLDRGLATICLKCLEKKPSLRYPTAKAFAEDLEAWLAQCPIAARPPSLLRRLGRWSSRHPAVVAAGGMAAILLVTVALALHWRQNATLVRARATGLANRGDSRGTRALDLAYGLLERRKYDMARDMFKEALQEARSPDDILEAKEGLRVLDGVKYDATPAAGATKGNRRGQ